MSIDPQQRKDFGPRPIEKVLPDLILLPAQDSPDSVANDLAQRLMRNFATDLSYIHEQVGIHRRHMVNVDPERLRSGISQMMLKDVVPAFDRDGLKGWSTDEHARFTRFVATIEAGSLPNIPSPGNIVRELFNHNRHISSFVVTDDAVVTRMRTAVRQLIQQYEQLEASSSPSAPSPTPPRAPTGRTR